MSKKNYFEPNEHLAKIQKTKQKIIVRFASENDVRDFIKLTGINLVRGKTNKVFFKKEKNELDF